MNGTTDDRNAFLNIWEPQFTLQDLPSQGRLYDPDGTLYAILLGEQVEIRAERRRQPMRRGDLVVVPQSVAVEVEPAADFVGLQVAGSPPYHFRERFIQVQGFELIRGSAGTTLDDDARHRVRYAVAHVDPASPAELTLPPAGRALVVPLEGEVSWSGGDGGPSQPCRRPAELTGELARLVLQGSGSVAVFLLSTAEIHLARRLALFSGGGARAVSPESSG